MHLTRNGHSTLKEQHAAHEVDKEKKEQLWQQCQDRKHADKAKNREERGKNSEDQRGRKQGGRPSISDLTEGGELPRKQLYCRLWLSIVTARPPAELKKTKLESCHRPSTVSPYYRSYITSGGVSG